MRFGDRTDGRTVTRSAFGRVARFDPNCQDGSTVVSDLPQASGDIPGESTAARSAA
ncbi:hypothetical protein KIH27_06610 [Mycobacterium sp. M1]|uniref:Uncharacterized protein n=1 Tax=Mycolicibacter acidiphilus TaxID=2835306 RepID=A0ABS5RG51_9MYCO|nr:hypothetical protein [Mycolicibacter acidiphilus]MBS9533261.1 hypothetical protein [Mycolicibacter acidiphilus]